MNDKYFYTTSTGAKEFAECIINIRIRRGRQIIVNTTSGGTYEVESYNQEKKILKCHSMSAGRQIIMVPLSRVFRLINKEDWLLRKHNSSE